MANLLRNANFSSSASPTLLIGTDHMGPSAAPDWTTWNNTGSSAGMCGYLSTTVVKLANVTKLVPVTAQPPCGGVHDFVAKAPPNTAQVMEVCTNGAGNGIVQVFSADAKAPQSTLSSVWVYVMRGTVGMGTGHGGNTGYDAVSKTTYQWERLFAPNGVSPATEFIVYSANTSTDGAWFFVADAEVDAP